MFREILSLLGAFASVAVVVLALGVVGNRVATEQEAQHSPANRALSNENEQLRRDLHARDEALRKKDLELTLERIAHQRALQELAEANRIPPQQLPTTPR
jgi:hypothetical protein